MIYFNTPNTGRARVCQVLYSGLGGHASVAFSLLGGDSNKNWDPSMLFVGIEPVVTSYKEKCHDLDVTFSEIRTTKGRAWLSWVAIFTALQRFSPDAVVLHSINSLLPVALYCIIYRKTLISVEHTSHSLKALPTRLMGGISLYLSKRTVVLTDFYQREHLDSHPWFKRHQKVVVIPNGIDVTRFSKSINRQKSDIFRIGMAARFSTTKRQDILVSAMKILVESNPDINWHLTLAGGGDCHQKIRDKIKKLGLGNRIELPGNLDELALVDWFQTLDLYVHASEGEALSTSMLQAMSMGLPIVASDVPGINNLLHNNGVKLGVLASENSPSGFANAIVSLYYNNDFQQILGSRSRESAVSMYSQEQMFSAYNKLIQRS